MQCSAPLTQRLPVQICGVTCCGLGNFEQHCASKRHLRKLAQATHASEGSAAPSAEHDPAEGEGSAGPGPADRGEGSATTYVGPSADCRSYCKQVGACLLCPVSG